MTTIISRLPRYGYDEHVGEFADDLILHGTISVAGSLQGLGPAAPTAVTRNQTRWPGVRAPTVALLLVTTRLAVYGPVPLATASTISSGGVGVV